MSQFLPQQQVTQPLTPAELFRSGLTELPYVPHLRPYATRTMALAKALERSATLTVDRSMLVLASRQSTGRTKMSQLDTTRAVRVTALLLGASFSSRYIPLGTTSGTGRDGVSSAGRLVLV